MVTSEMLSENVRRKVITKCYILYLMPVIVLFKAAYTGLHQSTALVCGAAETILAMKTELRILGMSLLLAFNASHAFAEPNRHDWRDELRAMHQQGKQQQPARPQQPAERSEGQSSGAPANESSDQTRKNGKMTAEERRALRRQINEAGRDIYSSSH